MVLPWQAAVEKIIETCKGTSNHEGDGRTEAEKMSLGHKKKREHFDTDTDHFLFIPQHWVGKVVFVFFVIYYFL